MQVRLEKKGEMQAELASIWSTLDEFKNAIASLETGVLKVTERMDNFETLLKDYTTSQDNKRKIGEKALDDKVSLYQETINKNTSDTILKLKTDLNNKITGVKSVFVTLKKDVEERISTLAPPDMEMKEAELHRKLNSIEERMLDTQKFEADLNTLDEHYTMKDNEMHRKINLIEERMLDGQELKSELNKLDEHYTSQITECKSEVSNVVKKLNDIQSSHVTATHELSTTQAGPQVSTELAGNIRKTSVHEPSEDNETVLIMCMDSNSKYLDRRKLWDLQGTEFKRCAILDEVKDHMDRKVSYKKLQYFFMSVGCNDIDSKDGEEVFDELKHFVLKMKDLHPDIKVIVSEITPRMDDRDAEVKIANRLLNDFVRDQQDVFITRNGNLRRRSFFYPGDSKHIRRDCIARFAANIKYSLRAAYGRKKFIRTNSPQGNSFNQQQHQSQPKQQQPSEHYTPKLSAHDQKLLQQQWLEQLKNRSDMISNGVSNVGSNATSNVPCGDTSVQGLTQENIVRSLASLALLFNPVLGT